MLPVPYTGGSSESSDNIIDAEWKAIKGDKSSKKPKSKSFRQKVEEKLKKGQEYARQYQGSVTGKNLTRQQVMRQQREMRKRNVKKIAAAREIVESQAMGYREQGTPKRSTVIKSAGRGIVETQVEQPIGMDMMLGDTQAIRYQRTVYLAEPEKFKTHRSYGNFDFIGKKSKRGSTDWKYDTDEMFR